MPTASYGELAPCGYFMLNVLPLCCITCFQVSSLSLPYKRSAAKDAAVGLELIATLKQILPLYSIKTLSNPPQRGQSQTGLRSVSQDGASAKAA